MKHVLVARVENKPGVLNRVASLFRRRNFNIISLTVGETEDPAVSRMTIVVDASKTDASMVQRNLLKLINVIDVEDLTHRPAVRRDLVLIKVRSDSETHADLLRLAEAFQAKVADISPDSMILELTGEEDEVQSFIEGLRPYGILEMMRTGLVAMARGSSEPAYQPGVL